jgi:hypothetical protein
MQRAKVGLAEVEERLSIPEVVGVDIAAEVVRLTMLAAAAAGPSTPAQSTTTTW